MKRLLVSLALVLILVLTLSVPALAQTSQTVTVTATPSYVAITNAPITWSAGAVIENTDKNTANATYTITNSSSVVIDISFYISANWTHTSGSNDWTYGAPAENTAQLKVSSANGGTGGSTGEGDFDIVLVYGAGGALLVCDNVSTVTSPTWEMLLDAPSTFTHGDAQSCNVTMTAAEAS